MVQKNKYIRNKKVDYVINMYTVARQFKNAVLINEMISLPDNINGLNIKLLGGQMNFHFFSTNGNKMKMKIYPFLVNKAFACEIYLKLILEYENENLNELYKIKKIKGSDKHNLLILLNLIRLNIKEFIVSNITKNIPNYDINVSILDEKIKCISSVFYDWRYIYEKGSKSVDFVFLNLFCDLLDAYTKNLIYASYNYDVDKDMR